MSGTGLIACWLLCARPLFALPPPPAFLLPGDIIPTRHSIELTLDPSRETFDGSARIEVELSRPLSVIWMNAKDLTPKEASVESGDRTYPARAQAAGGIDPRREPEPDAARIDRRRIDVRYPHERLQPGLRRPREHAQTRDRERSVLAHERSA